MKESQNCIDLIKRKEGCVLHPYRDIAGVPTIGWGSTRYMDGHSVTMRDKQIPQIYADSLLQWGVDICAAAIEKIVTSVLNQNQFDALVDFSYQEGVEALHSSTLLKLVNQNPNDSKIRAAFAVWNKYHKDGVLLVSASITQRRVDDIKLYFS